MSVNAHDETYELITLFGEPALFTNSRVERETVPQTMYCYDLRGSDYDPDKPTTAEHMVMVNHAGTVLVSRPLLKNNEEVLRLGNNINFVGECVSLADFLLT